MTGIAIVPAGQGDTADMTALLAEMDLFYGTDAVEPIAERTRQTSDTLFSGPPSAHALLTWDGAQLAGLAA